VNNPSRKRQRFAPFNISQKLDNTLTTYFNSTNDDNACPKKRKQQMRFFQGDLFYIKEANALDQVDIFLQKSVGHFTQFSSIVNSTASCSP
jgi:hypothetical protein